MASIELIPLKIDPLMPRDICAKAYERFDADEGLLSIPVVDMGKPLGLLRRHEFMLRLADRFGRPLFEKRPVTELMDAAPLYIELGTSLERINALLVQNGDTALQTGFVFIENGIYAGTGTAYELLRANMEKEKLRAKELDIALVSAEAAGKAKSNFLANMSHELRTPLNAIIGFSEFIINRSEDSKLVSASGKKTCDIDYVQNIHESGRHLLGVINSILDMSKLEADAFTLREVYFDPKIAVDQASTIIKVQAQKKNIAIINEFAPNLPGFYADEQVLKQILLNLMSNAVKFSAEGSSVRVKVGLHDTGALYFSIRDQGIGISEADLDRVKRPFMQAEASFSRRHEGTGLGLPLVDAFVKAHGGRFNLTSELGKGTTATICFPVNRLQEQETQFFDVI